MSAADAKAKLKARLQVLVPDTLRVVFNGQPFAAQDFPLAYLELRDAQRQRTAGPVVTVYRFAVVVLIRKQDTTQAEQAIETLIDSVADALEDFSLDGARGLASAQDYTADYDETLGMDIRRATWLVRVKMEHTPITSAR